VDTVFIFIMEFHNLLIIERARIEKMCYTEVMLRLIYASILLKPLQFI